MHERRSATGTWGAAASIEEKSQGVNALCRVTNCGIEYRSAFRILRLQSKEKQKIIWLHAFKTEKWRRRYSLRRPHNEDRESWSQASRLQLEARQTCCKHRQAAGEGSELPRFEIEKGNKESALHLQIKADKTCCRWPQGIDDQAEKQTDWHLDEADEGGAELGALEQDHH